MKMRKGLAAVLILCLVGGCDVDSGDKTDYNKPFNATERRNEATANMMRESIKQDRAAERAYQANH